MRFASTASCAFLAFAAALLLVPSSSFVGGAFSCVPPAALSINAIFSSLPATAVHRTRSCSRTTIVFSSSLPSYSTRQHQQEQDTATKPQSGNNNHKTKGYSDVDRHTYQLNESKRSLENSELRAMAAERRVKLLQKRVKELEKETLIQMDDEKENQHLQQVVKNNKAAQHEGKQKKGGNKNSIEEQKEIERLTAKVRAMKDQIEASKVEYQKNAEDVQAHANHEVRQLSFQIRNNQAELEKAKSDFQMERDLLVKLTKDMEHIQADLAYQLGSVKAETYQRVKDERKKQEAEKHKIVSQFQVEFKAKRASIDTLQDKLDAVQRYLSKMEHEMTQQLMETKAEREQMRTILMHKHATIVDGKDARIDRYEDERKSMRKLLRQSLSLTKSRVAKVFRKIK